VPVLATVHPLRSLAEAEQLRRELPDGCLPVELVERMARAGEGAAAEGGRIAVELAARCAEVADGIILARADRPEFVAEVRAVLPRPVAG
jgi:hypothetical protein